MQAILIDDDGMFVCDVVVADKTILTDKHILTPCPNGFYHPKWDGEKWVEGLTQAEIDTIKASVPTPKATVEELEATVADLIQLLADKGVIY